MSCIFCMYVIFSILSSPPCEPKWDEKEVKQLIENIEKKMILDLHFHTLGMIEGCREITKMLKKIGLNPVNRGFNNIVFCICNDVECFLGLFRGKVMGQEGF